MTAVLVAVAKHSHIVRMEKYHGTTILGVKKDGRTVIAGDGQVSLGNTVIKPNAKKVRRIGDGGKVIGGFAVLQVDSREQAIELGERFAGLFEEVSVEVRRVMEFEDLPDDIQQTQGAHAIDLAQGHA